MRRTVLLLAGVLPSVVALGSDSPKEYDNRVKVVDELQGKWQLTEFEDKTANRKPGWQCVKTFRSGICMFQWTDGDTIQTRYYIDTTRKPPHLDMDTYKCLYQIDGNTLRIAWRNDQQRPQGFKDDGVNINIYERVK